MRGDWPESAVATELVADETAVAVGTDAMVVVEVADGEVVAGDVGRANAGGTMGGASVACEDAEPSPPHAANDSNATAVQVLQPQRQE